MPGEAITRDELSAMDAYWRAANYLTVGQVYLLANPLLREPLRVFCYQARKWVGALTATLGGLDTLVFTGGIGAHAPAVRRQICSGLEHLGVVLDDAKNAAGDAIVSAGSACVVHVLGTDEERMIARRTRRVLGFDAP
jgi:acetate kinase